LTKLRARIDNQQTNFSLLNKWRKLMLFLIHAFDKPNHLQTRMDNRPDHVAYLKSFGDKLNGAGATLDNAGQMNGSLVILDLAEIAEAEAFAANDPYAKAGLFEKVIIQPWNKVLP